MLIAVLIDISGVVQGVGFRPFLYGIALEHGLTGFILNRGNAGVQLRLEGEKEAIDSFIEEIGQKKPFIARIDSITTQQLDSIEGFEGLTIKESEDAKGPSIVLPTDIATCDDCIKDMIGKGPGGVQNKYYMYPFVACSRCGPRFTTVIDLPYDRERTTMIDFPLCDRGKSPCKAEYDDPVNRRFHAQTFSCPNCGPNYFLADREDHVLSRELDSLKQAVRKLKEGNILAVKGIGGVHLVCDARNDRAVLHLRTRKGDRKYKPFAIMVQDLAAARCIAHISEQELQWLTSFRRPILLLKRKAACNVSMHVAPGLSSIGIMLPYMGTHHLLFQFCKSAGIDALVFTSGNQSGLPMAITNEDIKAQLISLADFFLLHDRRIQQRCDDSVGKVIGDALLLNRRSRGFVPEYIPCPVDTKDDVFIATGPELHSTAAILKGNKVFATQYIGDVENLETLEYMEQTIAQFKRLLRLQDQEIAGIACDAHPLFQSSAWAREQSTALNVDLVPVYHHHAHCASLVLDNMLDPGMMMAFIACDGVGYGADGNAWGGEIFSGPVLDLQRAAHLKYARMPGADQAVRYPGRMLASYLQDYLTREELDTVFEDRFLDGFQVGKNELDVVLDQLYSDEHLPLTSSTGRILDAASFALNLCSESTYEGEAAIRLEGVVPPGSTLDEKLVQDYLDTFTSTERDGTMEIDLAGGLLKIVQDTSRYTGPSDKARHALAFQVAVGQRLACAAIDVAVKAHVDAVGFTGGVSYDEFIFSTIKKEIEAGGLHFYHHMNLPPGDGGISAGQALVAFLKHKDGIKSA
ncbi:MAG TPA: carbamoyltransferase HypF [Candidatus Lokiarchaeia archaeon]|nr:carbamoyltransferase HypF [Candidatus Lokiarchaeia archaeon]